LYHPFVARLFADQLGHQHATHENLVYKEAMMIFRIYDDDDDFPNLKKSGF
jgi:hypothetical protein